MKAIVYVTLKAGVLDPAGQAVTNTLGRLGFDEVKGVRVGKYIEIELPDSSPGDQTARDRLEEMCEKLLANTVIEDYRIELAED